MAKDDNVQWENLSRLLTQPLNPPQQGFSSLSQARSNFADELQDPNRQRLLMASTEAEVGNQGPLAKQAYIESVMNRASAEGRSLISVLLDSNYYPASTQKKLGATFGQDETNRYAGIINNVLAGSNISNLATGNESGRVRSGGAAITFNPGTGERFVEENWTQNWRANALASLAQARNQQVASSGPATTPGMTWQNISPLLTQR